MDQQFISSKAHYRHKRSCLSFTRHRLLNIGNNLKKNTHTLEQLRTLLNPSPSSPHPPKHKKIKQKKRTKKNGKRHAEQYSMSRTQKKYKLIPQSP